MLQIRIPNKNVSLDFLLERLRYLETAECRETMTPLQIIIERREVTYKFRNAIHFYNNNSSVFT